MIDDLQHIEKNGILLIIHGGCEEELSELRVMYILPWVNFKVYHCFQLFFKFLSFLVYNILIRSSSWIKVSSLSFSMFPSFPAKKLCCYVFM